MVNRPTANDLHPKVKAKLDRLEELDRQTATLKHGTSVIESKQNSPVDIEIYGNTLTSLATSTLDATKYYVLADKFTKVFFPVANASFIGITKFQGYNERPILSHTATFEGKQQGSNVEVPHYTGKHNSNTLRTPSESFVEFTTSDYGRISALDGSIQPVTYSANGNIAQVIFSFNIVEEIERKLGKIPVSSLSAKVQWIKDNVNKLTGNWHGYGSSPTGNKATFTGWNASTSTWNTGVSNTANSPYKTVFAWTSSAMVDSNGFVHFLAYAEPSDGVTLSTINTDFVNLEIELKSTAVLHHPNVPLYEVSADEYNKILVDWNETEVLNRFPAVRGQKHLTNPVVIAEGENLLPPFYEWTLHPESKVLTPYSLELNATNIYRGSYYEVPVITGQVYSLTHNGDGRAYIAWLDKNNSVLSYSTDVIKSSKSFTVPLNAVKARVTYDNNTTTGKFVFTEPVFNLGSTAKPFVPKNSSYLFASCTLGKIGDKKDILYKDNGEWKVAKNIEKDVVLDGSLGWTYQSFNTGFKIVTVSSNIFNAILPSTENDKTVMKFNGMKIKGIEPLANGDLFAFSSTLMYITIFNVESGWLESMSPTVNMIKAYFNGWKMSSYSIANPTTAPTLTASGTGATLPAGTYYVKYTWVNASGETMASPVASITTTAGQQINVTLPTFPEGVTSANVYISTTSGSETKQGSTTTTTYTQSAALVAGTALPASNTTAYRWVSVLDSAVVPTTQTEAFVADPANKPSGYIPYKLSYVRSSPLIESPTVEGDIVLNEKTQIKFTSGFTVATDEDGNRTYTFPVDRDRIDITCNGVEYKLSYSQSLKDVTDDLVVKQSDMGTTISIHESLLIDILARLKAGGL